MNNNNMQGIRQISPEEVQQQAQKQFMTPEELQKTQVLNLQDVEEAARIERLTSKKPAIIVAVIGLLLLTFGTTFQIAKILSAPKEENSVQKRENRELVDEVPLAVTKNLNCTLTALNNPDGTDAILNINYDFLEDKLTGFTKTFTVTPTVGNPLGEATVQKYIVDYQAFMNQQDGYNISVVPNDKGIIANVQVDLNSLDMSKLPQIQQTHFSTSVQYQLNTPMETIKSDMLAQKFVCE